MVDPKAYKGWLLIAIYLAGPALGGFLAGLFQRFHVFSTHQIEHPGKDYPYMLEGKAVNPPRLAGDLAAFKEMVAKCANERSMEEQDLKEPL